MNPLLKERRPGIVEPTVFAMVCVIILIGLGMWQLDRKTWKENLIAVTTERLARAPEDLPLRPTWDRLTQAADEYRRVTFPAEFLEGQEALVYSSGSAFRPDVKDQGYWVFSPARLPGGSVVMVNRGHVPLGAKDPATRPAGTPRGIVDMVGVMRWPETRGLFTPADDVKNNVWYLRDPQAMSDTHKWANAAPFYIEQESPLPPGGLPLAGKLAVALRNNHLQYAVTWFGLALAAAGVYVVWLAGRLRRRV